MKNMSDWASTRFRYTIPKCFVKYICFRGKQSSFERWNALLHDTPSRCRSEYNALFITCRPRKFSLRSTGVSNREMLCKPIIEVCLLPATIRHSATFIKMKTHIEPVEANTCFCRFRGNRRSVDGEAPPIPCNGSCSWSCSEIFHGTQPV